MTVERLKTLLITDAYPTKEDPVGGVFVRDHAKAIQLHNDVVVLHCAGLAPNPKGLWWMEEETDKMLTEGVPTYRIRYRRLPIPKAAVCLSVYSAFRAYGRLVAQGFCPDIIHAHFYGAGVLAVLIGKLHRIPVVITEHSSNFPRGLLSPGGRVKAWLAFRWADRVLPVSHALQRGIERYGIRARFRIVPNVVDPAVFYPPPHLRAPHAPRRMLFVGRLDPIKGVPYLLQAIDQLRRRRGDWHLDVVGDGPARAEYERLAARLGVADKVTFHGLKSKREVAEFMRRADFFVLPSLWDNCPCAAIEAVASGLPVVSTLTGGIPEIVGDGTGILVPPGDAAKLSSALATMLESLNHFDRRAIAASAEKYAPESVGQLICAVYQECVRR